VSRYLAGVQGGALSVRSRIDTGGAACASRSDQLIFNLKRPAKMSPIALIILHLKDGRYSPRPRWDTIKMI
jgi:hypothetical protein